jgi:hypothetical protein
MMHYYRGLTDFDLSRMEAQKWSSRSTSGCDPPHEQGSRTAAFWRRCPAPGIMVLDERWTDSTRSCAAGLFPVMADAAERASRSWSPATTQRAGGVCDHVCVLDTKLLMERSLASCRRI